MILTVSITCIILLMLIWSGISEGAISGDRKSIIQTNENDVI